MRQHLGLEPLGDAVIQLELGVERIGRRPGLSQGQTCPGRVRSVDVAPPKSAAPPIEIWIPVGKSVYFASI